METDWKALTSIFTDVMISPWNLLVGGLLIRYLPTSIAFISIVIGYCILGLFFYFYGGLGLKYRTQSSDILGKILGSKVSLLLIPIVLALGQIGWAGINIELGGKSLASIFSTPFYLGILAYAVALIIVASLNLNKQGFVKAIVVVSSLGLIGYLLFSKLGHIQLNSFFNHQPSDAKSLLWGVSIVVASLISFTTVTPDFFKDVKNRLDIIRSIIYGVILPGAITAFLGCFLFFDQSNFDLIFLVSSLSFPLFPHIFNVFTNTDGAVAIYTPGLKIESLVKLPLKTAIIIAGCISTVLALLGITAQLEPWLKVLSLLFPAFIGIALASELFARLNKKVLLTIFWTTIAANILMSIYFPSVLIAIFLPVILAFLYQEFRQDTKLKTI